METTNSSGVILKGSASRQGKSAQERTRKLNSFNNFLYSGRNAISEADTSHQADMSHLVSRAGFNQIRLIFSYAAIPSLILIL